MIVITGAGGHVGGLIADRLAERGLRHDSSHASRRGCPSAPVPRSSGSTASRTPLQSLPRSVRAIESSWSRCTRPVEDRTRQHRAFVDVAVAAEVGQLVYLSCLGAGPEAVFLHGRSHGATEAMVRESGLPFTIVRMSMWTDDIPNWFDPDGVIRAPAGDGRISFTYRPEIASVIAATLTEEGHEGQVYDEQYVAAGRSMRFPSSTYRLQLRAEFGFENAAAIVPYLAALGVGDMYRVSNITSTAGSPHGYDGIDPTRIDEPRGGVAGFRALAAAAQERRARHARRHRAEPSCDQRAEPLVVGRPAPRARVRPRAGVRHRLGGARARRQAAAAGARQAARRGREGRRADDRPRGPRAGRCCATSSVRSRSRATRRCSTSRSTSCSSCSTTGSPTGARARSSSTTAASSTSPTWCTTKVPDVFEQYVCVARLTQHILRPARRHYSLMDFTVL